MKIELAGDEVVTAGGGARDAPVFAIEFGQLAADGEAGQLFEKQATLAAAGEAQLADELLVSGFASGGAGDARHEFPIGHGSRVDHSGLRSAIGVQAMFQVEHCKSTVFS